MDYFLNLKKLKPVLNIEIIQNMIFRVQLPHTINSFVL